MDALLLAGQLAYKLRDSVCRMGFYAGAQGNKKAGL
jgi:hypothetical protein